MVCIYPKDSEFYYLLRIDVIQVVLNELHTCGKVCLVELVRNVPA